jgi:hypothetical protein
LKAAISKPLATNETPVTSTTLETSVNEASGTSDSLKTSSNTSSETTTVNLTESEEDPPGNESADLSYNRSPANAKEVLSPVARPAPLKTDADQADLRRHLQDQKKPSLTAVITEPESKQDIPDTSEATDLQDLYKTSSNLSGITDNVIGREMLEAQYQDDREITFTMGMLKAFVREATAIQALPVFDMSEQSHALREMLLQMIQQTQPTAPADAGLQPPLKVTNITNGPSQNQPTTGDRTPSGGRSPGDQLQCNTRTTQVTSSGPAPSSGEFATSGARSTVREDDGGFQIGTTFVKSPVGRKVIVALKKATDFVTDSKPNRSARGDSGN